MKQLILSFVATMSISAAIAQNNSATLSQNGSSNNSSTTQSGQSQIANVDQMGVGHKSTTTQTGAFQQNVDVIQSGNYNTAISHQDNAAGTGNFVKITQTTTGVGGNTATADQSGKNMQATILQNGNNKNNLAVVKQSGPVSVPGLYNPYLGNAGDGQVAYITQLGGNNNRAFITQQSDFGQGLVNTATIKQMMGDDNLATINQLNSVGFLEVGTITQAGSRNIGLIDQTNVYASRETATLTQTGSDNKGYLRQDIQTTGTYVVNNVITALQQGNFNQLDMRQGGGSGNTATLSQLGNHNVIAGLTGSADPAIAIQKGDNNVLNVTQTGDYNTAHISQIGTGNTGTITQSN